MKTRTTAPMLIAFVLAFLAHCTPMAYAFVVDGRPVGITFGQTARVTAANTGTTAIVVVGGKLDRKSVEEGKKLRGTGERGEMMTYDLNSDDIIRENNRIKIRVIIECPIPH